ncbi:MAG: 1,4-dihydroxy-2-naphthoate octaprenyltransferase [Bacteroidaceae bacterium]|nr:1,4-dihydroxy-2-naphthoate octaprenyltransferase [Bacteroidaceae bacterium]
MVKTNSLKAWVLAARPKTLTGAVAPVLVGAAFAYSQLSTLNFQFSAVLCFLFAVFMQIDANLVNDYFDFRKGTDREDRLGPERACAQGWITPRAMQWGIAIMTTLSCLVGIAILFTHMQWELLVIGVLCVLFCFLYTTHLSYLGLGDFLVLVFFGFVPVIFTHYVITMGGWSIPLAIASLAMGLATDNLLMVNNYRDRHQDKVSGKRTIVVRIIEAQIKRYGEEFGRKKGEKICLNLYLWLGVIAMLLAITSICLNMQVQASILIVGIKVGLPIIYFLLHIKAFHQMKAFEGKALNQVLGVTARNIFLFGVLLAISVFL